VADDPRLRKIEQLRSVHSLIAGATHDINNPLAAILGYCHLLRFETDPEKVKKYVGLITSQATECRDLIARLEECASHPEPKKRPLTLDELVKAVFAFDAGRLAVAGIAVQREIPDDLPPIQGDADLLRKVIGHLLDNAVAATESNDGPRTVRFSAWAEGDTQVLEIRDNGGGIARDLVDKVFDPQYTSRRSGSGVGFGLPTALSIMSLHGGDLRVSDNGPGAGLQMVFGRLPRHASGRRLPVLCVDDQDYILDIYTELFDGLDVDLYQAVDIPEALELLDKQAVDLIICDFALPSGTAVHLYEHLQESESTSASCQFVVCTGNLYKEALQTFVEAHGLRTLAKPFTTQNIVELLDACR